MTKSASVKLELNIDDLKKAVEDELDDAVFHGGLVVADAVRQLAPSQHIRDSVYVSTRKRTNYHGNAGYRREEKPKRKGVALITAAYFTAAFFEFGTRAHIIRPKDAKALRMPDGRFVARAKHPGQPARPFLRPALDESSGRAQKVATDRLRRRLEAR